MSDGGRSSIGAHQTVRSKYLTLFSPIDAYAGLITSKKENSESEQALLPAPRFLVEARYGFFESKRLGTRRIHSHC